MFLPQHAISHLEELHREAFNVLPGTVNARSGAGIVHDSGLSQGILVTGRTYFEDELAEEATWASQSFTPCALCHRPLGGLTSTLWKLPEERESNIIPHLSQVAPTIYPPGHEIKMTVQEFCKLCEPNINKLKGWYSAKVNLIFQSWLKDIKIHVEDQNLTQRKAIQLVKDFTAKYTHGKVEFYVGMIMVDHQTLKAL